MKEGVDPLKSTITELKEKNIKLEKHIELMTAELKKVDTHYMNCCRAICATQGLVLKNVSGHEIQ